MSCKVEGCTRKLKSRGLCGTHWDHWVKNPKFADSGTARDRTRDSEGGFAGNVKRSVLDEFRELLRVAHVEDTGYATPCWLSDRPVRKDGYTQITRDGKTWLVHRWSKTLITGPLDPALQCDHLCRVRRCFRPSHLEEVTPHENFRRGYSPSAQRVREGKCKRGHEWTSATLYVQPKTGARVCRECRRIWLSNKKEAADDR